MARIGFNTSLNEEERAAITVLMRRNPDDFKFQTDVIRRGLVDQISRELGKNWRNDPEIKAVVAEAYPQAVAR
jgi:hypothetical protein